MALEEAGSSVTDHVTAEMVECVPAEPVSTSPLPEAPDATPTAQSQDATIEQTGAGPPPKG